MAKGEELMPFSKFKAIMNILQNFQNKRTRVSDFFEQELMEDSWCFITFGSEVETALVNLLADEFDCWYTLSNKKIEECEDWWENLKCCGRENDIEYWLYSMDEEKAVWVNDKKVDISSLESFYEYLVSSYKNKHNLTD